MFFYILIIDSAHRDVYIQQFIKKTNKNISVSKTLLSLYMVYSVHDQFNGIYVLKLYQ